MRNEPAPTEQMEKAKLDDAIAAVEAALAASGAADNSLLARLDERTAALEAAMAVSKARGQR